MIVAHRAAWETRHTGSQPSTGPVPPLKGIPMRKFRTFAAVAALAAIALLVPATAQAGAADKGSTVTAAPQRGIIWNG